MTAFQVFILAIVAILLNQFRCGRSLALLGTSALVVYWLQPSQNPVSLTYWLPTFTLMLTVLFWLITSTLETRSWSNNWPAVMVLGVVIMAVDLNRYFKIDYLFVTSTPRLQWVGVLLVGIFVLGFMLSQIRKYPSIVLIACVAGLAAVLLTLKMPSVWAKLIETISNFRGKDAGTVLPIAWLGFSYVAFRLIHTVLDRKAGRLPPVSLADYVNYVIFFPAFVAGPIDRVERFVRHLGDPAPLDHDGWLEAGMRLFLGLFKKFVIADMLAWIALSDAIAPYIHSTAWTWLTLYAYSLRIYFDFSGYTDIAIGLGRLMGVRLPENFNSPYFKPNLTQFWNSWHMTLTQWFRSYYFNPLTRALRSAKKQLPLAIMILFAQLSTMILIGLWHGVAAGFLLWGAWHGLGLFIHNRWGEWVRSRRSTTNRSPLRDNVLRYAGMFLTFHFVTVGWLFFMLPDPEMALHTIFKLLGVA